MIKVSLNRGVAAGESSDDALDVYSKVKFPHHINAFEAAITADPDMGIDEFLATKPKYTSRKYAPRVMQDAVAKEIDRRLKENDRRRGNGMRKQCLKNTDIHRQLMEKGLTVGYLSGDRQREGQR